MLKGYKHYAHKFDNLKEIDQLLERHKLPKFNKEGEDEEEEIIGN